MGKAEDVEHLHELRIAIKAEKGALPGAAEPMVASIIASYNNDEISLTVALEKIHRFHPSATTVSDANSLSATAEVICARPTVNGLQIIRATDAAYSACINAGGIVISGAALNDFLGVSVSYAGDVNGDGYDDVIIGANGADPSDRNNAGAAYIIYGSASLGNIDFIGIPPEGYGIKISGAIASDTLGISVSYAGNINGDDYDDVIVGASGADPSDRNNAGAAYIIYGSASLSDIDLLFPPAGYGIKISGAEAGDRLGPSSYAGNVNGDDYDDVIVGASGADPSDRNNAGAAYIIYGSASLSDIDLFFPPEGYGIKISGAIASDTLGISVSYAGNINGDDYDDVIVGAVGASPSGKSAAGAAYIIYGIDHEADPKLANIDLLSPPEGYGIKISGAIASDTLGISVSYAGNINGDDYDDVIVGAYFANRDGGNNAGAAYIIYGFASLSDIDLLSPPAGYGIEILGALVGDQLGGSVSYARDVNGDGKADVIIGAAGADRNSASDSGAAYIIYGSSSLSDITNIGDL